jgi:hypothetical protein
MDDATRQAILAWAKSLPLSDWCIAVRKRGATANLTRTSGGAAVWAVDRSTPWHAEFTSRRVVSSTEIFEVGGIPFYFDRPPRPIELPLRVTFSDGNFNVLSAA